MEPHLNLSEVEANQRKYYGQTVMATLKHLGVASTLNDVIRTIANVTDQPVELVTDGVKRSLRLGTRLGFIVKNGDRFGLPIPYDNSRTEIYENNDN